MATILIGGGSGLIGTRLSEILSSDGHTILHLSRKENLQAQYPKHAWDLNKGTIDLDAVQQADYIINLAGAGIADRRWTNARKKLIIDSRTKSTLLIKQALEQTNHRPKAIIAASAIGYYGNRGSEWVDENSAPGQSGFLAESTQAWESAIHALESLGSRLVKIRIGIVLSTQGGALKPFLLQDTFRLGTYFGDGQQYYSWIHIDDLCKIFQYAIDQDDMVGTFNGVGPNPVKLYDLVKAIAEAQDKTVLMIPAPAFAIKLAMGKMSEIVLSSTRVSAEKVKNQGFEFTHPALIPALQQLIKTKQ